MASRRGLAESEVIGPQKIARKNRQKVRSLSVRDTKKLRFMSRLRATMDLVLASIAWGLLPLF